MGASFVRTHIVELQKRYPAGRSDNQIASGHDVSLSKTLQGLRMAAVRTIGSAARQPLIRESMANASNLCAKGEIQRIVKRKDRWPSSEMGISRLTVNQPEKSACPGLGHDCVLLLCEIRAANQEKFSNDQNICTPISLTTVAKLLPLAAPQHQVAFMGQTKPSTFLESPGFRGRALPPCGW